MSNLAHFRADNGVIYSLLVKIGGHTGSRLYSGNGGITWFAVPLNAVQSSGRQQVFTASRKLDDLQCRQAENKGDIEPDTLQEQIERAYWEYEQAQAYLKELLALKQCNEWENAQALMELE